MHDELYEVPLADFTTAREALAARLKAAGDPAGAADAKRARKPSVPAWATNQVIWHARDEWARLQSATHTLRKKHEKAAAPDELRQAAREQREALHACEARAAELLAQHGHDASPTVLHKVGRTLLALAHGAPGVTPGRLDHELQPPGFEALGGLTLGAPQPRAAPPVPVASAQSARTSVKQAAKKAPTKAEQKADERERARRRASVAAAETRQKESRRDLLEARARLAAEEKRRGTLESELDAARRACNDARRQLEAAEAKDAAAGAALHTLRDGSQDE
jgi:hypothetical protein